MKDIEILNDTSGVPTVHLHGEVKVKAAERGISKVLVSLSHSEVSNSLFQYVCLILLILCCPDGCHCICSSLIMSSSFYFTFSHSVLAIKSHSYHISSSSYLTCSTLYLLLSIVILNRFSSFIKHCVNTKSKYTKRTKVGPKKGKDSCIYLNLPVGRHKKTDNIPKALLTDLSSSVYH